MDLDDLGNLDEQPIAIRLIYLIVELEIQAIEQAQKLITKQPIK